MNNQNHCTDQAREDKASQEYENCLRELLTHVAPDKSNSLMHTEKKLQSNSTMHIIKHS